MQEDKLSKKSVSQPVEWVDKHGDYLYRYVLLRIKDPSLAEDLVQETFLSALKSLHTFDGRSSEKTWLVGILKHKIADHFKKSGREALFDEIEELEKTSDESFNKNGHWNNGPSEWLKSPDDSIESKQFWKVFKNCISALPLRLGNAFFMREVEGVKSEEICKELDISSTNLWVIMHRAREKLRKCLELNWFAGKESD